MTTGPITSWSIDGETVETVTDFIFLVSKITADGECSHEMKTLAPRRKSFDQLIQKQCQTLFFGGFKILQMVIAAMKLKDTYSLEGKL